MEPIQESFDTFGDWMLARLRRDMLPAGDVPPGFAVLHRFLAGLYEDMRADPAAYGIPREPFVAFLTPQPMREADHARHEALKAARMRVRKVVFAYLRFLFQLGQAGQPAGDALQVQDADWQRLSAEAIKKGKAGAFAAGLERAGLAATGSGPVVVTSPGWPGLLPALAVFCRACAAVKDFDVYLFRRCDTGVLAGKSGPVFPDALGLVPAPFREGVCQTDARLMALRFKREIFVDGGDMTYRVRYSKKSDRVVYWLRIQETFHPDLGHYLRWRMDDGLTERLFARLDATHPGLADTVFAGIKPCAGCYGPHCLARAVAERGGVQKSVCTEQGWNAIGFTPEAYDRLWVVAETLADVA